MEKKKLYLMIALIIAIFIIIGVIRSFLPNVHDHSEDDYISRSLFATNLDTLDYKLNISEEGYTELKIGPFLDGFDGFPGINVTIHLKNNNISALTGADGYAIFNITYHIEYDEYMVTLKYREQIKTFEIYLENTED